MTINIVFALVLCTGLLLVLRRIERMERRLTALTTVLGRVQAERESPPVDLARLAQLIAGIRDHHDRLVASLHTELGDPAQVAAGLGPRPAPSTAPKSTRPHPPPRKVEPPRAAIRPPPPIAPIAPPRMEEAEDDDRSTAEELTKVVLPEIATVAPRAAIATAKTLASMTAVRVPVSGERGAA